MTTLAILQTVFAGLSFVATIAVSFTVYWLQKRHEQEIQRIDDKRIHIPGHFICGSMVVPNGWLNDLKNKKHTNDRTCKKS